MDYYSRWPAVSRTGGGAAPAAQRLGGNDQGPSWLAGGGFRERGQPANPSIHPMASSPPGGLSLCLWFTAAVTDVSRVLELISKRGGGNETVGSVDVVGNCHNCCGSD